MEDNYSSSDYDPLESADWEDSELDYSEEEEVSDEDLHMELYYPDINDDFWTDMSVPDWDIPVSEDMDADAFVQTLKDWDRARFWRLAEMEGLRIDLLKKVGYEYTLLSDDTGWTASKYLQKHLQGWPNSEKSIELMSKMYNATIIENSVSNLILRAKHVPLDCLELRSLNKLLSQPRKRNHFWEHAKYDVPCLFIEEFKDELTPVRRELFNLYRENFVVLKPYESFVSNNGFQMIKNLHTAYGYDYRNQYFTNEIALYKLLSKGGSFNIQSTTLKTGSVALGNTYKNLLLSSIERMLIIPLNMYLEKKWGDKNDFRILYAGVGDMPCGRSYTAINSFDQLDDSIDQILDNLYDQFVEDIRALKAIQDPMLFYYGAYNIIDWPAESSMTDRCIFLYKLAHICGFDVIIDTADLTNGYARKSTTDRIKKAITKYRKMDKDGKLLDNILNGGFILPGF